MTSRVESRRFPYLPLRLEVRNRMYEVEALIDTGFDGDLRALLSRLSRRRPHGLDGCRHYGVG